MPAWQPLCQDGKARNRPERTHCGRSHKVLCLCSGVLDHQPERLCLVPAVIVVVVESRCVVVAVVVESRCVVVAVVLESRCVVVTVDVKAVVL